MKKYCAPEMKIIEMTAEDVVRTSNTDNLGYWKTEWSDFFSSGS